MKKTQTLKTKFQKTKTGWYSETLENEGTRDGERDTHTHTNLLELQLYTSDDEDLSSRSDDED